MIQKKSLKRISVLLAMVFINQIFFPTAMLAVTGGPGQPELESFTPFNSSDMVDPFSGDFTYNIPLLNVPGPNGGYPINIAYSGNLGTEQEAGWVGLGWSINPGAINRQLRGLPDDFDGSQEVTRKRKMKPNRTYTLGVGTAFSEVFGFDLSKNDIDVQLNANINLTVNNYNGFNMGIGAGFSLVENKATEGSDGTNDSADEPGSEPGSKKQNTKKSYAKFTKLSLKDAKKMYPKEAFVQQSIAKFRGGLIRSIGNIPSSTFFAGSGDNLSSIDFPRKSNSFTFDGKLGGDIFGVTSDVEFTLFYSQQDYAEDEISYPAYGYMYSESGSKDKDAILDFYTDKNSALGASSAYLPVPVLTNDVFSVTGQGVAGVYRSQLGTVPLLSTPDVESNSNAYGFGLDLAGGTGTKVGFNPKASFTESNSGKWTRGDDAIEWFRESLGLTATEEATFEQSSFIKLGDLTDNQWHKNNLLQNAEALRFDLKTEFQALSWKPKAISQLYRDAGGSFKLEKADHIRKERAARSNLFKYFTAAELNDIYGADTHRDIYTTTSDLTTDGAIINANGQTDQNVSTAGTGSLIHQIEVENNHVNYVYGIPVFTNSKIDRTFSISPPASIANVRGVVNVGTDDDSKDNEKGRAALFNENVTGKFAHAYLLTEILSDDYVDISNNGVSEDDFGSYTKFDYLRLYDNFISHSPAQTSSQTIASYVPGVHSDEEDDMATYSRSNKEIYYLHKVETKTHYAEFQLAVRGDDYAQIGSNIQKLAKLKKITLYKKNSGSSDTEIKSVEFEYNDDESTAGLMQGAPAAANGKLTLKRIRFTFEGQKTDTYLNPYEFDYYNSGVTYSQGDADKWGKYQPDTYNDFNNNYLYPYTAQDRDLNNDGVVNDSDTDIRNTWASAWRLKTITLPTGGEVDVQYEGDDYGYVQDKNAQAMYQIVGLGTPGTYALSSNRIYFKLKENVATGTNAATLAAQLSEDMENVYFKALVVLKNKPSQYDAHGAFEQNGDVKEFVEGYLDFTNIGFDDDCLLSGSTSDGIYQYAYVNVANGSGGKNPIRLAAANYLRLNGQHLNSSFNINFTGGQSESNLISIASSIIQSATSDKDMNRNFVETVIGPSKNYCSDLGTNLPSIIRLNAQGAQKYGGGSRVSEIIVKDNWNTMQGSEETFNMRQVYTYQTEDGQTSGVAEYEPLLGGEENPLRQPHYYSTDRAFFKDEGLMFDLPATEALYPSPRVGYSRVVVESIPVNTDGTDIADGYTLSSNGILVNEFYTAKDYPVRSSSTKPKKVNLNDAAEMAKWVGGKKFFQPGFSQGYYTELNDMHGKQRRVSTYSASLGTDDAPFQSTTYFYKTIGGFSQGAKNYLNNEVEVLTNDGAVENQTIGQVSEAWVEMSENQTKTLGGDIKTNLDLIVVFGIPIPIPTALPTIDYNYRMRRTLVLNKLVSKTAILDKVVTQQEGRTTIVNNLLFDYENGQPLLTQVLNDHDKPIYSYNRPQHWVNSNFKHPWRNWKARVSKTLWVNIIQNGDIILADNGTKYWVENAEAGTLRNQSGTASSINDADFPGGTIVQSGYTGRSGAMSSQLVSLNDPTLLTNREFLLFHSYNHKAGWKNGVQQDLNDGNLNSATAYYDCDSNPLEDCSIPGGNTTFCPTVQTEGSVLLFGNPNKSSTLKASVTFPDEYENEMGDFTLEKIGGMVRATHGNIVLILGWSDPENLFPECIPGVLDAGVSLFAHDVKNYEVLGTATYSIDISDINDNPSRYKNWHDYKSVQSLKNVGRRGYTDNNQTDGFFETRLDEDGSYTTYVDYNFSALPEKNSDWVNQGTVNQYDPFGNVLESENAIGIHSAELFNEDHTLVTATGVNSQYDELGYHNFEDLSGSWTGTHGHLNFSSASINTTYAHTGEQGLNVSTSTTLSLSDLEASKKYRLSFWQQTASPLITASGSNTYTVDAKNIDGWDLITYTFTSSGSGTASINFNGTGLVDDIRFYPANAALKTFVYDLNTYRLIAQMDANNFATLYGYNEEGTLSQVKKETDRGIQTVSNYIVHRQK